MTTFDCLVVIMLGYVLAVLSHEGGHPLAVPGAIACMAFSIHGALQLGMMGQGSWKRKP